MLDLLFSHLENESNSREDFDDFLSYIQTTYDVDLTTEPDDLPFPVIDEILTYLDYDPGDEDGTSDDPDEYFDIPFDQLGNLIIPRVQMVDFQNNFNAFTYNVKLLHHLDDMNCITNDRTDDAYYTFQRVFKPTIYPLLKLYRRAVERFQLILHISIDHYMTHDLFDFEYSDHD